MTLLITKRLAVEESSAKNKLFGWDRVEQNRIKDTYASKSDAR